MTEITKAFCDAEVWDSKVTSANFQHCKRWILKTLRRYMYANSGELVIRTGSPLEGVFGWSCIMTVLFVSMPLWALGSLSKHTSVCFLALMPKWINMSAAVNQRAAVVHWISSLRRPGKVGQAFPTGASETATLSHLFLHFFHKKSLKKHGALLTLWCAVVSTALSEVLGLILGRVFCRFSLFVFSRSSHSPKPGDLYFYIGSNYIFKVISCPFKSEYVEDRYNFERSHSLLPSAGLACTLQPLSGSWEHLPYVAWGAIWQQILISCCVKGPWESKWVLRKGGLLFSYWPKHPWI